MVYSQNNEDDIIAQIISLTNPQKTFVEFGSGTYDESNTRLLSEQGWNGWVYDIDPNAILYIRHRYPNVQSKTKYVGPHNVNTLVSPSLGLLSIDVNGDDYWIWKSYLGDASIVIIEYNAHFGLDRSLVVPFSHLQGPYSIYFGASLRAVQRLGESKGYTLVCANGVNAFFAKDINLDVGISNEITQSYIGPARHLPVIDLDTGETVRLESIVRPRYWAE